MTAWRFEFRRLGERFCALPCNRTERRRHKDGTRAFLLDEMDQRGPWHKFTPPARDRTSTEEMWQRLEAGAIDMMVTAVLR